MNVIKGCTQCTTMSFTIVHSTVPVWRRKYDDYDCRVLSILPYISHVHGGVMVSKRCCEKGKWEREMGGGGGAAVSEWIHQFSTQLINGEFSAVCKRLLRNCILSSESTGEHSRARSRVWESSEAKLFLCVPLMKVGSMCTSSCSAALALYQVFIFKCWWQSSVSFCLLPL